MEQVYYLYDTKPPRLVSPKSKRGVMTKTLVQIQIENRKFILEATGEYKDELELLKQTYNQRLMEIVSRSFFSKPLTLSRVLLALPSELYYYKNGNFLYIAKPNQDPKEQITWDLTKETLDSSYSVEQSEETQRAINKLFND